MTIIKPSILGKLTVAEAERIMPGLALALVRMDLQMKRIVKDVTREDRHAR